MRAGLVVKMATVLWGWATEEQLSAVFLWAKGLNAKGINEEIVIPIYLSMDHGSFLVSLSFI